VIHFRKGMVQKFFSTGRKVEKMNEHEVIKQRISTIANELTAPTCNIARGKPVTAELAELFYQISGISADFDMNDWSDQCTDAGVAISPVQAAKCVNEVLRTRKFMKGIHRCITEKLSNRDTVNVLYAGTGPYGALITPLINRYPAERVRLWLLDIQPQSIQALNKVVQVLELQPYIEFLGVADATTWQPESPVNFDIILSETMNTLLRREPQVTIFSHLQQFLEDDGELIPQQVTLGSRLVPRDVHGLVVEQPENIELGDFFILNKATSKLLAEGDMRVLSGTIDLPDHFNPTYYSNVEFTTTIRIYSRFYLTENQCSLNMPITYNGLRLQEGGQIKFEYKIDQSPKFQFNFPVERLSRTLPANDEVCPLNIPGLRRFWHKHRLMRNKELDNKERLADEYGSDIEMLQSLSIEFADAIQFIYHWQPSYDEFHQWVSQRVSSLSCQKGSADLF